MNAFITLLEAAEILSGRGASSDAIFSWLAILESQADKLHAVKSGTHGRDYLPGGISYLLPPEEWRIPRIKFIAWREECGYAVQPVEIPSPFAAPVSNQPATPLGAPDSNEPSAPVVQSKGKRGITKAEILDAEWPMPKGSPSLESILDKIPKWVDEACIKVGRAGKGQSGSHLWNPAVLAVCLASRTSHKQWICNQVALTNLIRNEFSVYFDEWTKKQEML